MKRRHVVGSERAAVAELMRAFRSGLVEGVGTALRLEARETPGWPDVVVARAGRLYLVEVKVGTVGVDGCVRFRVRGSQIAVWSRLLRQGVDVAVAVRVDAGKWVVFAGSLVAGGVRAAGGVAAIHASRGTMVVGGSGRETRTRLAERVVLLVEDPHERTTT